MLDKSHLAIKGDFSAQVTLPDGTLWNQGKHTDGSNRSNTKNNVQFVMKLDVSSSNGVGAGTTGWARVLDEDHQGVTIHPGGVDNAYVTDVHGDSSGDMILTYTGYEGYNATAETMTGGVHYLMKLSAADGSEVWKKVVPHALSRCTPTTDGSIFCGYTMSSSDGALDFGNGVTAPVIAADSTKSGIIKFDSDGLALWAKATHDATFKSLAVTADGTVLVTTGAHPDSTRSAPQNNLLSRIDTSAGNEGVVMWTDTGSGGGTHGFRGVQVTNDGTQVITFGQINEGSPLTLIDSAGSATTVTSRGSYEVFVAAYDAADGTGKWAMDGGGDGLDYFFAFGIDLDTNDVYVGGGVYGTPKEFQWGDVKRKNVMYQYKPSSDIPGYVGTTKAFTAQIKSTTSLPDCLDTCSADGQPTASDVKAGHCYIDRHCYKAGDFAPYPGAHCMRCDPTVAPGGEVGSGEVGSGPMEGSGPDTTSHCFIGGKCMDDGALKSRSESMKCDVASSTSEYTAVKGYKVSPALLPSPLSTPQPDECHACCAQLDMDNFAAGCYDESGSQTSSQETGTVKMVFV